MKIFAVEVEQCFGCGIIVHGLGLPRSNEDL